MAQQAAATRTFAVYVGCIAASIVCLGLIPTLGSVGFWSAAELPILDRTLATLGEARSGLLRAPWLPDALRTVSYAALHELISPETAVRLPHALATAGLVGLIVGWLRARGQHWLRTLWVAALVLAFPGTGLAAHTLLGNPVAELAITAAILSARAAANEADRHGSSWARLNTRGKTWALVAVLCLGLGGLAAGVYVGVAVPSLVIAVTVEASLTTRRMLLGIALGVAGVALVMAAQQGDGYIPLLADAKDVAFREQPWRHRFTAGLEQFGRETFPWWPIALLGLVCPSRGRRAPIWLATGLLAMTPWIAIYGARPLPLAIPTALCIVHAFDVVFDPAGSPAFRRFGTLAMVLGLLLAGKDAMRVPAEAIAPLVRLESGQIFPALELDALAWIERWQRGIVLALLMSALAVAIGLRKRPWVNERGSKLAWIAPLVPPVLATVHAVVIVHAVLVPRVIELHSVDRLLMAFDRAATSGTVAPKLVTYRARDRGVAYYAAAETQLDELVSRSQLIERLSSRAATAAVIPRGELAALHSHHREYGWPLFVLANHHPQLVLVANALPPGEVDRNPLPALVRREVPSDMRPTKVVFDDAVELAGWSLEQPLLRGSTRTLRLAFRVTKPLPSAARVIARFIHGRVSRFNFEPEPITQGTYPPNFWRKGDVILHEQQVHVPLLEIVSEPHELVIGIKRNTSTHYRITDPMEHEGAFDVRLRGGRRQLARIGLVNVY